MNTQNTKEEFDFIFDHIWWSFIAWIWYKSIVFRCLDYRSLKESKLILLGILFACCVLGILLQMKNQRNSVSVLMDILAGYGLYTVLTYYSIKMLKN